MKDQKLFHIIIVLMFVPSLLFGQIDGDFGLNIKKALAAASVSEYQTSLNFCNKVLKLNPNHPRINYLAARLNEQLGNSDLALKYLKNAAKLGYTSNVRWFKNNPKNDPVFKTLRKKKEFETIIKIMDISDKPVNTSSAAFIVNDKRLNYYEGITYDPVEKMFYFGSDYKIAKVDTLGNIINIIEGKQDGLEYVNGIHVDPIRRTLWACSNDENRVNVGIFKYDLSSGRLIKKYIVPADGPLHMFNDLVIHSNGDIFISDTYEGGIDGAIYKISLSSDSLELFFKEKHFLGPNGITISEDGEDIYVATDRFGIWKINIKTKSSMQLDHKQDFNSYGIDGLYFTDNYLLAIHCLLSCQVTKFTFDKNGTSLEDCIYLEKNTPDLSGPTTGVIVDDHFYFIAGPIDDKKGIRIKKLNLK